MSTETETPAPDPEPAAAKGGAPLLQMRGIEKDFLGVKVLHGIDLDCHAGEVHAIVGENGAGKSTLMKILAGAYVPSAGEVRIDGKPLSFSHPLEAQQAGVAIIYQEFNLLPDRTVAENIFLGREPKKGFIVDRARMERETDKLLKEFAPDDPMSSRDLVGRLPVARQQTVEIAKALALDARIIVMDEPTAPLSAHEVERLFERVKRLRERGIAVLYISHRLPEIFELAENITVIKDGQKVTTVPATDVTAPQLVKLMVGRELDQYFPERRGNKERGPVKLSVRGGSAGILRDIDIDIHAGEILGIAGLQGSGRTELARAIFGVDAFEDGKLEMDGKEIRIRSPKEAISHGIGFVTEDRKTEGLALAQPIRDNVALAWRGLGRRLRNQHVLSVKDLTKAVELRAQGLDQEVRFLSGGNQQKVVLCKWLATEPRLVIFDEPTRGIDVGAKAGIHDLIRGLANEGVAVMMISSELPEVIGMSDRIVVMRNGRIAGELPPGPSEPDIMFLATGEEDIAAAEVLEADGDKGGTA